MVAHQYLTVETILRQVSEKRKKEYGAEDVLSMMISMAKKVLHGVRKNLLWDKWRCEEITICKNILTDFIRMVIQ